MPARKQHGRRPTENADQTVQTRRLLCALCVSALTPFLATPAQGELFRAGRLLCSTSPRIGFLVGSTQSLRCVFYRRNASQRYIYAGRIRRVGLDLGITGSGVLSWAVLAKNRIGVGTMRGSYVGASGNVALAATVTHLTLGDRGRR